jgi:hypothetical protein
MPSDLESTAQMPTVAARDLPNDSAYRVNITIRICGIKPFNTEAVSTPFMRGIAKSKRTKSGLSFVACSIASTPSTASPHTTIPE